MVGFGGNMVDKYAIPPGHVTRSDVYIATSAGDTPAASWHATHYFYPINCPDLDRNGARLTGGTSLS